MKRFFQIMGGITAFISTVLAIFMIVMLIEEERVSSCVIVRALTIIVIPTIASISCSLVAMSIEK
ncbi:MAG: hypothetical protein KBC98_02540 [Candidatus Pacebacteria bacterium]|nr:hypothetical protein [Candidatus Paceibacterota bacterium]